MCGSEGELSSVSHMLCVSGLSVFPGRQIKMSQLLFCCNSQLESISQNLLLYIIYLSSVSSFVSQPENKSDILAKRMCLTIS